MLSIFTIIYLIWLGVGAANAVMSAKPWRHKIGAFFAHAFAPVWLPLMIGALWARVRHEKKEKNMEECRGRDEIRVQGPERMTHRDFYAQRN